MKSFSNKKIIQRQILILGRFSCSWFIFMNFFYLIISSDFKKLRKDPDNFLSLEKEGD